jgi:hypothetical protein
VQRWLRFRLVGSESGLPVDPSSGRFARETSAEPLPARVRKGWDSNPRWACTHGGFQDRCLKPLGHPSTSPESVRNSAGALRNERCGPLHHRTQLPSSVERTARARQRPGPQHALPMHGAWVTTRPGIGTARAATAVAGGRVEVVAKRTRSARNSGGISRPV